VLRCILTGGAWRETIAQFAGLAGVDLRNIVVHVKGRVIYFLSFFVGGVVLNLLDVANEIGARVDDLFLPGPKKKKTPRNGRSIVSALFSNLSLSSEGDTTARWVGLWLAEEKSPPSRQRRVRLEILYDCASNALQS